jgi:hypothetical protein
MSALFRTLLLWLMVLAVPAQGWAAASMALCGQKHHGVAEQQAQPPRLDTGVTAAHAPCHEADAPVDSADQHQCNVCSSCCSVGALISAVPALPDCEAALPLFATVVSTIDPFAADGPDRPPRNLLV